jgi:hypothetical protein
LLRQEPPLQSVREPRNDALQIAQLLVEIGAQPRQFLGIAEFFRADGFVEAVGESAIIRPARLVRERVARMPRLAGLLAVFRVAFLGLIGRWRFIVFAGRFAEIVGGKLGILGGRAFSAFVLVGFAFFGGLILTLIFVLGVFLVAVGKALLAQVDCALAPVKGLRSIRATLQFDEGRPVYEGKWASA